MRSGEFIEMLYGSSSLRLEVRSVVWLKLLVPFMYSLNSSSYLWLETRSIAWLKLLVPSNAFIEMLYGLSYALCAVGPWHHGRASLTTGTRVSGPKNGSSHFVMFRLPMTFQASLLTCYAGLCRRVTCYDGFF